MFFAHSLSAPKVQLKAMETCATVAQVIELFNSYDRQYMATYQVIFGDKNGNSVIIESDSMIVKNGIIYIYHFHNYADVQIIDLKKELGKGEHSYSILSLFGPATFAFSDFVKRSKIKTRTAVPWIHQSSMIMKVNTNWLHFLFVALKSDQRIINYSV